MQPFRPIAPFAALLAAAPLRGAFHQQLDPVAGMDRAPGKEPPHPTSVLPLLERIPRWLPAINERIAHRAFFVGRPLGLRTSGTASSVVRASLIPAMRIKAAEVIPSRFAARFTRSASAGSANVITVRAVFAMLGC